MSESVSVLEVGGGGEMVKTCYPSAVLRVFRGWEFPGLGSIPGWGTNSLQAQASWCDKNRNRKKSG